ncbi:hypothetical protein [Helicobacter cetorum]|uniref:hypothetical protein n=1 Tax=Helicobacter cetorum TaxID=138563 RepID=UPI0013159B5D|nr:hypothetical protein [Helicobacter cetorum]
MQSLVAPLTKILLLVIIVVACTTSQDTINCNYSDYSSSSNGSIDYAIGTPQISAIQTYGANLDTLLNVVNSQEFFLVLGLG